MPASIQHSTSTSPTASTTTTTSTASARLRALLSERISSAPSWVLVTQLFLGLGWLRAATEKVISTGWWRGDVIRAFVAEHGAHTLGWYQPFIDLLVTPYTVLIAVAVTLAQAAVGVSFITGRFVGFALAVASLMNLSFIAAGAVNPSAFYLVLQGAIALWLAERSGATRRTGRGLVATAAAGAGLAALSAPYISTLHPDGVIEDPAMIMVTGGGLAILGSSLAHHRLTDPEAG